MRDVFEEVKFGHVSKRWWIGPLVAFGMMFLTELIAAWLKSFIILISAFIWGTIDYVPSVDVTVIAQLLSYIGVFPAVSLVTQLVEYRSVETLGYFKEKSLRELLLGWLLGFGLISLVCFLPSIWFEVSVIGPMSNHPVILFVIYFIAYHVVAMGDILIYQGYLLPVLARFNRPFALAGSCLVAILGSWMRSPTLPIPLLVNNFLFSLLSGILVLWRKNLWLATGLQAIWSVTIYHLYAPLGVQWASLFQVNKPSGLWLGGELGVGGSVWLTMVLIVLCGYLALKKVSWKN
ncbi:CPBP family glutamic-type intramembrane protease [Streptococcus sp. S784/96/1]|uniref:CPBP family glutamic-type intramembrane protease n=1 Tax=Streptococcus sp. S784/96/1 TaxID=2653499 RepID=UPI00138A17B0|nr:hypothetical protein [Streptococcus sp. S784/96/1]